MLETLTPEIPSGSAPAGGDYITDEDLGAPPMFRPTLPGVGISFRDNRKASGFTPRDAPDGVFVLYIVLFKIILANSKK